MINKFTLVKNKALLIIAWKNNNIPDSSLSYEYLRISTEQPVKKVISHKKQVQLLTIEPVGKHGFRLCFDDSYRAIYSVSFLIELARNYQQRWQQYLDDIKASGHSREMSIDIKQL